MIKISNIDCSLIVKYEYLKIEDRIHKKQYISTNSIILHSKFIKTYALCDDSTLLRNKLNMLLFGKIQRNY